MENASVVDLFCGAGGLTCGLESAGLTVTEGVDVDECCRYPYEANTSARFVGTDVHEYSAEELESAWDGAEFRILVGCAPCQPYSTYTRNSPTARRAQQWELMDRFATLVDEVRPDIVSMENVPPLVATKRFRAWKARLGEAGYHVDNRIVDCRHFGAPQTRRRLVLLASRMAPVTIVEAPHPEPWEWTDVESAIGHLPRIGAGEVDPDDPLHRASRLSETNLARIQASRPGGTWRDWPSWLVSPCHVRETGGTYPSVYGRMEWDKPAPTITGQCFGFGNGRFGHPEQDRAVTLREASLLQTFPEGFEFFPPGGRFPGMAPVGRMIGNAVPPVLGKAIGESIVRHIQSVGSA